MNLLTERSFLETGWMRLPLAAGSSNLTPVEFRVLAHLVFLADDGQLPPGNLDLALACSITPEEAEETLAALERRHVITRRNPTDWDIHSSETWA